MKSVFILLSILMMMLAGCSGDSEGAYSAEGADAVETESSVVVGSSINEPTNLPGMSSSIPAVPAFPSE